MIGANFLVQSKVESTERLKVIVKRVILGQLESRLV